MIKCLLAAVLILGGTSGCVTGGQEGGVMIGVVAIYSGIAQASQSGDKNARTVWCGTLDEVDKVLLDTNKMTVTDSERIGLQKSLVGLGTANGYRLHVVQLNKLIDDAISVLSHQDTRTSQLNRCS